jgi:glycyl-tRNA synthetase beta chain
MSEYFFELLTEEIPAWMHDTAQATLAGQLAKLTEELKAEAQEPVRVSTTARRIIFLLNGLPEKEADREEELKGPPRKAAYDPTGNPTAALQGFLKKNNASAGDLLEGGDYVRIQRKVTGRATADVLQQRIPQIIEGIRWPKMMRWGNGEHAYIRPVHSIISIFDGAHLPLTIFGIASGETTVGHRTLARGSFKAGKTYNEYVTNLELARVVVDPVRRRHVMAERARVLANEVRGEAAVEASIWAQWQYLTEYPGVVRAEFRPEYLALPEEVLVTVMRVHQKQLPIRDAAGKLTSWFLAVLDNEGDPDGNAAYGNSFVTNARFADAKFFYDVDRKTKLADRFEQLSHLQVHAELGNYAEKTQRVEAIAAAICKEAGLEGEDVAQAARLCKTDLVTEMVKEFTDLQGRVGGIYAREEGYAEGVWQAVYDHYLPINVDDPLPRGIAGAVVSLADRVDTLVGFFRIGAKPTGSRDPYALRRAAQGVVQILLNRDKRQVKIGINKLIELATSAASVESAVVKMTGGATHRQPTTDHRELTTELLAFFADRVKTILETSAYGFAYDEIAAAMEAGWAGSLTDLVDRISALKQMRNEANFLSILDSAKRIANITAGHESSTVNAAKLEHDAEKRLNDLATVVSAQIDDMIGERDYNNALQSFAAMAGELESFFDEVMVMVEDEAVRKNRMSLLRKVGNAVGRIADVTKIVVDRREYRP